MFEKNENKSPRLRYIAVVDFKSVAMMQINFAACIKYTRIYCLWKITQQTRQKCHAMTTFPNVC